MIIFFIEEINDHVYFMKLDFSILKIHDASSADDHSFSYGGKVSVGKYAAIKTDMFIQASEFLHVSKLKSKLLIFLVISNQFFPTILRILLKGNVCLVKL